MVSSDIVTTVLSVIALVHLLFSILMLSALRVTKNVPFASKFLSYGLILFDVGYITSTAVNRFQKHPTVISYISLLAVLFHQLAYTTMTLMAIERMLVLKWPMQYIRLASERKIKQVICSVWICVALLLLLIRFILCWVNAPSILSVFSDESECVRLLLFYHLTLLTFGQIISTVSYIVVMKIVRRQTLRDYMTGSVKSLKKALRVYKSTGMVFIYIIVMTITSLVFYVSTVLLRTNVISQEVTRAAFQSASVTNCMLDPFLYVLWYRECRLACKKLIRNLFCRFSENTNSVSQNTNRVFQIDMKVRQKE